MKKILSYLLVLCLMCSLLPAAVFTASAAEGGNCGENVRICYAKHLMLAFGKDSEDVA